MQASKFSDTLNTLRWVSAFLVVIGHLRSFIFINYAGVEQQNLLVKLFYYITGFGHQAVMVFFIISGYLVGGGLLMKYKENKLDSTYLKLYFRATCKFKHYKQLMFPHNNFLRLKKSL